MEKKLESLQSVFSSIHDYVDNIPLSTFPMSIYIWIDTNQDNCKAITGQIHLEFSGELRDCWCPITESKIFAMLMLMDKLTPIYKIIVEGHPFKAFIVSKTEEYMKKGCKN